MSAVWNPLANKSSANQRRNIILKSTYSGLQRCRWQYRSIFIRVAVVACQFCEIPRNSQKIPTYSSSRSSKVINLGVSRKLIYNFLLFIDSNFGPIPFSRYWRIYLENSLFSPPHPRLTHLRRNTLWQQHNLYTAENDVVRATISFLDAIFYIGIGRNTLQDQYWH